MEKIESESVVLMTDFKNWFEFFNGIVIDQLKNKFPDLVDQDFDRIKYMTEYNVPGGKLNRGMMVLEAFNDIAEGSISEKDRSSAICLGWCIEWCQAFFLMADDVMDSSLTRRGRPCWFRHEKVGLMAVNDSLLLRSSLNLILKNQFKEDTTNNGFYYKFSELFREIELSTIIGQMLDMTSTEDPEDSSLMKRYKLITKYKTSLYSFYLPFACAYILANHRTFSGDLDEELKAERDILLDIGHLFQVQDDILDVFGDSRQTGKIGTDIEEGKLTWLLCKSLAHPSLSPSDRITLRTCRQSAPVKELYQKYRVYDDFLVFEREMKEKIEKSISTRPPQHSKILFKYLNRIISRIK